MDSHLVFLSRWIRNPRSVASIAPRSRHLAQAMAQALTPRPGWVVELGGGTGSITRALLRHAVPPTQLAVVERDPTLARHLRQRFPTVTILEGEAQQLPQLLKTVGIDQPVRSIVSGLPILIMDPATQSAIMRAATEVMARDAEFIQFTYSLLCPIPRDVRMPLGLDARCVAKVWRNLPPARVWKLTRARTS